MATTKRTTTTTSSTTKANNSKRAAERAQRQVKRTQRKGPVARMWELCDKMRGEPRGAVIAAAVKKGINENTARTQYQRWFSDNK